MVADHAQLVGWEPASDPVEVHRLLLASDRQAAAGNDLPTPVRTMDSTSMLVAAGAVHVLRSAGCAVASFTLTEHPTPALTPYRGRPPTPVAYLRRLAVDHEGVGSDALVGVRCLRAAVEIARRSGARVLRAETNPDLTSVLGTMHMLGFRQFAPIQREGWMRRVLLELVLGEPTKSGSAE